MISMMTIQPYQRAESRAQDEAYAEGGHDSADVLGAVCGRRHVRHPALHYRHQPAERPWQQWREKIDRERIKPYMI